ncbi:hypothetical protein F5050DRAFT_1715497 [Lentinula boryana]|uniref:Uncharacterized protein n=1 Tax=Lentinula boryana TaxID=40481 RepID=A0ABQ8Q0G0_9AGAR|nr:hypothetical protein F5050DRAFT_1715497 [Lentinula boryana]
MNISEGTVVARELPEVTVAFSPIRDEEFEPYRKLYPEPFSEEDTARSPKCNRQSANHGKEPNTPNPDDPPPKREGSEHSRWNHHNNRPARGNVHKRGRGGGPPEPSDDGGSGDDHKDEQTTQQPSEDTEHRAAAPDKFNPRSLVGIGETYVYEPKLVSEEECLDEILRVYIDLVNYHLLMKPATGNNNAQKTILQNIPRPEFYYGDEDIMKFDTWARTLIHWLNVADQCGPES